MESRQGAAAEGGAAALRQVCAALGLDASESQVAAMAAYLALLQRWNRTYNLTAVREAGAMLTMHLADCLAAVAALRRRDELDRSQGERRQPDAGEAAALGRVLDVGSGGGLPGVLIALFLPAAEVVCIDAVAKKAAFIREAAGRLGLPNLRAEHGRVEQWRGGAFDLITARAFASLADLVRLARAHLAPGGRWMAMKGQRPEAEIAALPGDVDVFHVEPLSVPGLDAARCLVWMRLRRDT